MSPLPADTRLSHCFENPDSNVTGGRRFAVCTSKRVEQLPGLSDLTRASIDLIDPWMASSGPFIAALNEMQTAARSDLSLGIPAWALYDCAESTGAVIGFSDGESGPGEPISMVAATPMILDGAWHFYALCARDPGLIAPTLGLAIGLIRPREITAVLGYKDKAFGAFVEPGRTELVTAWTPAHTVPASATIRVVEDDRCTPGGGQVEVNSRSESELIRVQRDIENGARYRVSAPPDENGVLITARTGG